MMKFYCEDKWTEMTANSLSRCGTTLNSNRITGSLAITVFAIIQLVLRGSSMHIRSTIIDYQHCRLTLIRTDI